MAPSREIEHAKWEYLNEDDDDDDDDDDERWLYNAAELLQKSYASIHETLLSSYLSTRKQEEM